MTDPKDTVDEAALEARILSLVDELITARQARPRPFLPGVTPLPYAGRVYAAAEVRAAVAASLQFWLTLGPEGEAFERELSQWLGVREVVLANSGSSANLLAFSALTSETLDDPIRPGDEVVTAAAGFPTTVSPILQNGCVPVYVDVDPRTCNADPAQIEAAISGRTRAIMVAHTLGNPFDVDAVSAIAKRHGLRLVEDNCDALGSTYRGRKTGTFGDLATSSFYPAHHITMGEGGAVCTDSARLRKVVESFRDWGRDCWCPGGKDATCGKRFAWDFSTLPRGYDHKYVYRHVGYNLKPTDLQAAIGRVQLRKLETFGEARRRNFGFLREALAPLEDEVAFMEPTEGADPSWFGFLVRLRDPDHERLTGICRFLDERRIGHRRLMAGNLARQPAFHRAPHRVVSDLRHTDAIMNGAFFVGVYPGLTEPMLEYLAASVTAAVRAPR